MTRSAYVVAALISLAVAAGLAGSQAGAQQGVAGGAFPPTRVAVILPVRVIAEMQEAKDSRERLKNEVAVLQKKFTDMKDKVQALQDQARLLKPESTQGQEKMREFIEASINLKAGTEILQRDNDRNNRNQLKTLYDKMILTTEKVAKQKGIDIVLSDNHTVLPDVLPEDVNEQALVGALRTRNIMYFRPEVDITTDVIAALDAEYKK